MRQVGEGEFGSVHRGKWHGTVVAIKVLRRSDEVALGDFRCAPPLHDFRVCAALKNPKLIARACAITGIMHVLVQALGSLHDTSPVSLPHVCWHSLQSVPLCLPTLSRPVPLLPGHFAPHRLTAFHPIVGLA